MIKQIIIPMLVITAVFTYSGCNKQDTSSKHEKKINVTVKPAETKLLRPFIEAVGTLNPYEEVTISAEVEGIIANITVDEGTVVTKGMLISAINDTDYLLDVTRAKAMLRQATANLSNINMEYKRKEALFKDGLISVHDYDSVSAGLSLAEAERDNALAVLSLAEHKLTKTKIYSPISGIVKERAVSGGSFVRNGTPVCTVIQVDPLKLNFSVSENNAGMLKKGQDLLFKVETLQGREFSGKLTIIYPGLDEKTRTLKAEAVVPNPGGVLRPGFFADVKLFTGGARGTLLVPATALLYEGETIKVFTIDNETAKEHMVKTGTKYGEMIEIREGLKAGDSVVTAGQQNLSEGIKVNVAR